MELKDGARQLGLELDATQLAAFAAYQAELLDWNQRFNLTAVTDPAEITAKHFLDSLSCLTALTSLSGFPLAHWLAAPVHMADVGAGAGFPGLPLKIIWPALRLTLLESTGKKCRFLQRVVDELALRPVQVVKARAEDYGRGKGREHFDIVVARALARLPVLLEYTLPLLRVGGWLIAQKGREPQEELAASELALDELGGRLHQVLPVTVPGLAAERTLVIVAKVAKTPKAYPRQAGTPRRQPLGVSGS